MTAQNYPRYVVTLLVACALALSVGCGTNQFEQELLTEEAAVKLARETQIGGYELMATAEVKKLVDDGEDFLLIDAMPKEGSFQKGHIPGAVNFEFPKQSLETWDDTAIGQSQDAYEKLLGEDKDRKIVVYCGFVKCARSHNAAALAQQLGYTNVLRYPGGIHAWRGANYELEK